MSDIHLRESNSSVSSPRTKPTPTTSKLPLPFSYTPSDDGTDENLLVLLHGLGDSHTPFAKLGRSLKLPQTAVLALRAPEQIPYLYEQAFQWYTSFDPLGEIIDRPDPTPTLAVMAKVFDYLVTECKWSPNRIHLFGFGQGGSVAAESAIAWWRKELAVTKTRSKQVLEQGQEQEQKLAEPPRPLGSVVSISGPLLSYPTLDTACPTPILIFYRSLIPRVVCTPYSKAFARVQQVIKSGQGESMPRSRDEWEPIMRFWSETLGRRIGDGVYEVMTGTAA